MTLPVAAQPSADAFFGNKRAGCLSPPQAGEFLTAPKKAFARGKPKAKLQGMFLLVLFFAPKKRTRIIRIRKTIFQRITGYFFDFDPDSDSDLDKGWCCHLTGF
ncbi:MAG: hypothetical protein ACOZBW_12305, partial [Thermodesulfobacteriota bacterium]